MRERTIRLAVGLFAVIAVVAGITAVATGMEGRIQTSIQNAVLFLIAAYLARLYSKDITWPWEAADDGGDAGDATDDEAPPEAEE